MIGYLRWMSSVFSPADGKRPRPKSRWRKYVCGTIGDGMSLFASGERAHRPMLGLSVVPPWMLAGRPSSTSMQLEVPSLYLEETMDKRCESVSLL